MHCCASSAAKVEALIPWTRDPSGRRQSQQKSEFRRTTDLPCRTRFCVGGGAAAEDGGVILIHRHCEPTGRANARPMTGSAKQSTALRNAVWIASSLCSSQQSGKNPSYGPRPNRPTDLPARLDDNF